MTEEIDLDELDVESDDEPDGNPGDWFWRGEGDPAEEPPVQPDRPADDTGADDQVNAESTDEATTGTDDTTGGAEDDEGKATARDRVPHVPRENKDSPVGIPVDGGGAGVQSAGDAAEEPPDHGAETADTDAAAETGEDETGVPRASGPHGGDIDDMTMALTYGAMQRLEDPKHVIADANAWADWVGIVGDVAAFVINKFQRDHRIDVDFFNGSSQGPAERLADVDETSMFYAERMVVVGTEAESWMADPPGWEFVPLSEAAEKADWAWSEENGTDA